MKRLMMFLLIVLIANMSWADNEYPNPTMEQVNFLPENYEGVTVFFDNALFQPDFNKKDDFDNIIYTFFVKSKNSDMYIEVHYGHKNSGEINFYVNKTFAGELINAQLESGYHKANLYCTVEKHNATIWPYEVQTYWLCKVIKIEMLDSNGNITETFVETGMSLPGACEEVLKDCPECPECVQDFTQTDIDAKYDEGYNDGVATCEGCTQSQPNEQYEAGKQYCMDNPEACGIFTNDGYTQANLDAKYQEGCDACSNGTALSAIISPELNIHIPALQYETLLGTMDLWANFEFAGESNGDILWKLSDFGEK